MTDFVKKKKAIKKYFNKLHLYHGLVIVLIEVFWLLVRFFSTVVAGRIDRFIKPLISLGDLLYSFLKWKLQCFFFLLVMVMLHFKTIVSLRLSLSPCPLVQAGEETAGGWEDVKERCCGSTVSFLFFDYKGVYMKLLTNVICFQGVWVQSLNPQLLDVIEAKQLCWKCCPHGHWAHL